MKLIWIFCFRLFFAFGGRRSQVLPRSSHDPTFYQQPWSPSPLIDEQGFVKELYKRVPGKWEDEQPLRGKHKRIMEDTHARIRQVPGDGNCLFNAIVVALCKVEGGRHYILQEDDFQALRKCAQSLRKKTVDFLEERLRSNPKLFLQGDTYIPAQELLNRFASQYGMSIQEYCDTMRQDGVWAGGPEIVALSNMLHRPIHLYELHVDNNQDGNCIGTKTFCLRRMCCFGSPRFDSREPLHVLSADSRFPDIHPGRQLRDGNHFLAVFPTSVQESAEAIWKPKPLRGGGTLLDKYEDAS
jgi:hypothetical protein